MELVWNGVRRAVIALALGYETVETTYIDPHAELKLQKQALVKTNQETLQPVRNCPDDNMLAFRNGQ